MEEVGPHLSSPHFRSGCMNYVVRLRLAKQEERSFELDTWPRAKNPTLPDNSGPKMQILLSASTGAGAPRFPLCDSMNSGQIIQTPSFALWGLK